MTWNKNYDCFSASLLGEAIAVPELWIYDSKKLKIYLLRDGHYIESDNSPNFSNIPLTQIIAATVERAWQVGTVQALKEFEGTLDKSSF